MAPLTWKNVDAPDNTNVANMLSMAARNFSGGFSGLGDAFSGFRENQVNRMSAPALAELAKVAGGADVGSTLARIDQMVRPENRSSELTQQLLGLNKLGLDLDGTRSRTRIGEAINSRSQQTHDRGIIRENQEGKFGVAVAGAMENSIYGELEKQYNLPSGYLARTEQLESGGNPNAQNPDSSAGGPFQFTDATAAEYGLTDRFDRRASAEAAARLAKNNTPHLTKTLGRYPTAAELYLAHQQGAGGAAKLLAGGDAPAESVVGSAEARLNRGGGKTANEMASQWINKFNGVRVTDALDGENNLVPIETIRNAVTGIWDAGDTANRDRDDNRDRDKIYNDTLLAERLAKDANAEYLKVAPEYPNAALAIQETAARADLSPELKLALIEKFKGEDTSTLQQLSANAVNSAPPGMDITAVAYNQYKTDQKRFLDTNEVVQMNNQANEVYGSGDPALALYEELRGVMGEEGPTQGKALSAINAVAKGAGVSEKVAALLLAKTARRGRMGVPFDWQDGSQIRFHTDAAIAMGKDVYSDEKVRAATEIQTQADMNQAQADGLWAKYNEAVAARNFYADRGNAEKVAQYEKTIQEADAALRSLDKTNPPVGRYAEGMTPEQRQAEDARIAAENLANATKDETSGEYATTDRTAASSARDRDTAAPVASAAEQRASLIVGASPGDPEQWAGNALSARVAGVTDPVNQVVALSEEQRANRDLADRYARIEQALVPGFDMISELGVSSLPPTALTAPGISDEAIALPGSEARALGKRAQQIETENFARTMIAQVFQVDGDAVSDMSPQRMVRALSAMPSRIREMGLPVEQERALLAQIAAAKDALDKSNNKQK